MLRLIFWLLWFLLVLRRRFGKVQLQKLFLWLQHRLRLQLFLCDPLLKFWFLYWIIILRWWLLLKLQRQYVWSCFWLYLYCARALFLLFRFAFLSWVMFFWRIVGRFINLRFLLHLEIVILKRFRFAGKEAFLHFVASELVPFQDVYIEIVYFLEFGFLECVLGIVGVFLRWVFVKVKIEHVFVGRQIKIHFHFSPA